MLPKEDRKAMLLRIFDDDSPLTDSSKNRFLQPAPTTEPPEAKGDGDDDIAMKDEEPEDVANEELEDPVNEETERVVNLQSAEPVPIDNDDEEGITGTVGLAGSDITPGLSGGKGVGDKQEIYGTSVDGPVDTSGQNGG